MVALDAPDGCFLGTEEGEWLPVGADGRPRSVPARLQPHSAALVTVEGELFVATYAGERARLRDGHWTHLPGEPVVLALVETAAGTVMGDAAGNLTCLEPGGHTRVLAVGEPVTALATAGHGLAVLGSHGSLGMTSWPVEPGGVLREVATSPVDGPWALFRAGGERIGVLGLTRAALVYPYEQKVVAPSMAFPEGIRDIVMLQGGATGYCLLTDPGELWLLDGELGSPSRVGLPRGAGAIAGLRATGHGGVLVWTVTGELYAVQPSRRVRQVLAGGVVLAYPAPAPERAVAVKWSATEGACLEQVDLS